MTRENPVPGRDCGDCTICCEYLKVDIPELQKPAGTMCPNCIMNKGCAIYETRPQLCRDWLCGWRETRVMGEEWRPDRSGILVMFADDDDEVPPGFEQPTVKFMLLNPGKLHWPPLVNAIASLIERGRAVYLQIGKGDSVQGHKTFLSSVPAMRAAIQAHDYPAVVAQLQHALEVLVKARQAEAAAQKS